MTPRYPFAIGFILLLSWLLVGGCATDETASKPSPQSATATGVAVDLANLPPLPQDPALRTGKLRNGLRYAIYPNKQPQGRASLRLVVKAGSLHETEAQRGLAHFLEHMAFSGSTHYPPGTLTEFFQRMGMRIGADTNAFTGFDRTIYVLELPQTDESTLAEAFRVFSDYAGGLLLLDEEIERERAIVLSEKRERDSAAYRAQVANFEFLMGDTLLPKRLPIGEESVIRSAGREQLLDFWNTWYRPERITVVAVGDFDVKKVESQIRKTFSPLKARAPARPEPDLGELTSSQQIRAFYHYEPEAPATTVRWTTINPYRWPNLPDAFDGIQKRIMDFGLELTVALLNQRLMALSTKEGAPFVAARVMVKEEFHFYREAVLAVSTKGEQWREALAMADQELRRAMKYGFRPDELAAVFAEFKTGIEATARSAANRHSGALANQIAEAMFNGTVFTHPHFDHALYMPGFDSITPEYCQNIVRLLFSTFPRGGAVTVSISGDAVIAEEGKRPEEIILAAGRASSEVPVEPLAEREAVEWAYANWGEPGTVVSDERVEDLDLRLVRFANGVRLNVKKTNFEPGLIRVWARVGEGRITEPEGMHGLAALAEATFNLGGLGAHSVEDLQRIFSGHRLGSRFTVEDDAFILVGETIPPDFRLHLQTLAAQLTDPGWRPEALRLAHQGLEQMYRHFQYTADGPLATEVPQLLASGVAMHGFPDEQVLLSRTQAEVRDWLGPQLLGGPLEVAIVGDIDPEEAIAAVAETLGTLPPRAERRDLAALRPLKTPEEPLNKTYRIPTQIERGEVRVYWPAGDAIDARRGRALSLLCNILEDRIRVQVRQQMGASYKPAATVHASGVFSGYGYFEAGCSVEPSRAQEVLGLIVQIGDDLAQYGVTKEELTRARQPLLTTVRQSLRNNQYWLSVLAKPQEQPETLDFARRFRSDVETITAEELNKMAKEHLGAGRASRVVVLPESGQ